MMKQPQHRLIDESLRVVEHHLSTSDEHPQGLIYQPTRLSETSWLDPNYVMTALKRLVFCPSSTLSWQVGMRVLITCRQVMLYHPQAVIYQPMLRLLHHLATYHGCVDLRG